VVILVVVVIVGRLELRRRNSGFCSESLFELLRVGRSVAGGEDEEGVGGLVVFKALVAEELRAIDPDMSKATALPSALHQLHKHRDSRTLRCQNEGGPEQWRTESASPVRPSIPSIVNRRSENRIKQKVIT
jgi:hypothetical protein